MPSPPSSMPPGAWLLSDFRMVPSPASARVDLGTDGAAAALHGGGQDATDFATGTAMNDLADQQAGGAPLPGNLLPVIVFHGDADTTVAAVNAQKIITTRTNAAPAVNGAPVAIRVAGKFAGRPHTRTVHVDARAAVVAESWIVHGAGHAWSGGNPRQLYRPDRPERFRRNVSVLL